MSAISNPPPVPLTMGQQISGMFQQMQHNSASMSPAIPSAPQQAAAFVRPGYVPTSSLIGNPVFAATGIGSAVSSVIQMIEQAQQAEKLQNAIRVRSFSMAPQQTSRIGRHTGNSLP